MGFGYQPSHPLVLDDRDGTLHGKPGERVIIMGDQALVVSAVVLVEHAIITPGSSGSVSFGLEVEEKQRRESIAGRLLRKIVRSL